MLRWILYGPFVRPWRFIGSFALLSQDQHFEVTYQQISDISDAKFEGADHVAC